MTAMAGQLIVSVSGVRDRTRRDVERFCALLDDRGVPVSFLVAPRRGLGYRLLDDDGTACWLRARRDGGDAVLLYGYDEAATPSRKPEFAALPAHEAHLRLAAADRVMEQVGLRTRLFVPPAWTASPGTVVALPRNGFRLMADAGGVVDLVRGTSERARVLGVGGGFLAESWWCRTVVLSAERIARRGGVVRLAASARQLGRPGPRQAMLDAVDLARLHGLTPTVYQWTPRRPAAFAA